MSEDELAYIVIGSAMQVHTALGPGLLESVYKEWLYYRRYNEGIYVEKEKALPVVFEEARLDCSYRLDILVGAA